MNLRNLDLNLLVIIDALLAEGSVTRAAERLGLTQPAVSQALARARVLFGDALLVRDGARMIPTPRARELMPRLGEILASVGRLLAPAGFDPASARLDFTIAANDLAELVILPRLIGEVAVAAPDCRIIVRSVEPLVLDHKLDFAIIGMDVPEGPLVSRDLYQEHFVMIARAGHPALTRRLSPEAFAALPQALVSPTGQGLTGPVDAKLATFGLTRRVALSVTRFTTLPQILSMTDFVAAVPSRFAERPEVQALCASRPLPFESPRVTMRLVWHRARDTDPAGIWLRGLV